MKKLNVLVTFATLAVSLPSAAGEWGIGPAVASLSAPQRGVENEVIALPYISYQGERLKVDLASISYAFYQTESIEIAVNGQFRFDGYEPKDSPALTGMEKRESAFDTGLSITGNTGWGSLNLELMGNISSAHEGFEATASYQLPYVSGRWMVAPSVGLSWMDDSLVDYYYGVQAHEATTDRPAYFGNSTVNLFAEVTGGYQFNERIHLLAGVKYTQFGNEITDSPIVDHDFQTTAFTALLFKF